MKKILQKKQIHLISFFLLIGIFFGKNSTLSTIDRLPAQTSSDDSIYSQLETMFEEAAKPNKEDLLGNWTRRCYDELTLGKYSSKTRMSFIQTRKSYLKSVKIPKSHGRLFPDVSYEDENIPEESSDNDILNLRKTNYLPELDSVYTIRPQNEFWMYEEEMDVIRDKVLTIHSSKFKIYHAHDESFIISERIKKQYDLRKAKSETEDTINIREKNLWRKYKDVPYERVPEPKEETKTMCYFEKESRINGFLTIPARIK